jgi:hypothetical protein
MSNTTMFPPQTNDEGALFSFSDLNWRPFAPDKLDEFGVTPNELWHNASTATGALVVKKSNRYAEYALSQAGLDYLVTKLQAEKIQAGIVVLARSDGARRSVVTIRCVAGVVAMLDGIPPREGPLGPYWWLNPDGTPNGVRPPSDSEVPF